MKSENENLMKRLIGEKLQLIYSDGFMLTHGSEYFEAKNIFLSIKDLGYINIKANYFECVDASAGYFDFEVSLTKGLSKQHRASLFSFYDTANISSISIYSSLDACDERMSKYDYAIVIERSDRKRVCLTGGESAFRNIYIYSDNTIIDRLLSGTTDQKVVKEVWK